ncbi:phospholipase [Legionella israelensis]|uniref:Phospholipase n=1 Tax=Legionella israelensis TaxID=454 RepID=A0AAX1EFG3_9GAMM|nr:phospholipase [Legionella israelensis]QBR83559.1 phospholipase [Legionella israelensis]
MMRWSLLLLCIWIPGKIAAEPPNANFALSEHLASGQKIALRFEATSSPEVDRPLILPNGLKLTFGNIISLGDLCGVVGQPITKGKTELEQQKRFMDAFSSFAINMNAISEINQLIQVIEDELEAIKTGLNQGESAESVYKRIGMEVGRKINCITGGGCQSSTWWLIPGRYLKLAKENFDHFAPHSEIAYLRGHQLALSQALKARKTGLRSDLELAYALDAFACHFLSDHFAAGHTRTPRLKLAEKVSPSLLGSLLAIYMHNEDNKYGLYAHNQLNEHWIIYGDFSYFNPNNQANRERLERLLQQSADAVFHAYDTGNQKNPQDILAQIPQAEKELTQNMLNITPLFYWDDKKNKLLRRKDINNPYDSKMTSNWWGWSTLLALKTLYGETIEIRSIMSMLQDDGLADEMNFFQTRT